MEDYDYEMEYSYNRKTGELTMTCEVDGDEMYNLECTIEISKNEIKYTYDTLEVYGEDMPFDSLVITFSTKADIQEPKKGEKVDLGNMDEDDLEDLVEDIRDELMDNDDLMEFLEDTNLYYYF